jgi:hypothetical protein
MIDIILTERYSQISLNSSWLLGILLMVSFLLWKVNKFKIVVSQQKIVNGMQPKITQNISSIVGKFQV